MSFMRLLGSSITPIGNDSRFGGSGRFGSESGGLGGSGFFQTTLAEAAGRGSDNVVPTHCEDPTTT